MASHSVGRICLIVAAIVIYTILLVLSYLSTSSVGREIGLFKNNTGDISDKFSIVITPAGWTFSIWGIIYIWQAVWLIYSLTTICRTNDDGIPIYMLPQYSTIFYIAFIVNNAFVITWSFLWDRQYIGWAALIILFTPLTLYVCLFFSYYRLYRSLSILRAGGLSKEVWIIRILVQNGIAFFATWVTIATLLNFAIVLRYKWEVKMLTACMTSLSILAAVILLWFILETFVFDKYVRYTVSQYAVLIIGLAGSLSKNFDLDKNPETSIMTAILLGVAVLLFLVKIPLVIYRHRRYPIKGTINDDLKGVLA